MIELLTTAQASEADRLTAAAGTAAAVLMEHAGAAVADVAASKLSAPGRVLVVAGPGNNGGDGYVAARRLAERGYAVEVLHVGPVGRLKGDAAEARRRWQGPIAPASPEAVGKADLIVDAIFGAGLARPVEPSVAAVIEAINAAATPVVAVDLPSGISGDTGAVMGSAVRAGDTVTFFRRKPGHLLLPGRLHCGQLHVADIGIADAVLPRIGGRIFANEPPLWLKTFPFPQPDGHKYRRGHAVVVSGGIASTGAARLAARGALRAGAGLVTIASPRDALAVNAAGSLSVMVRPADGAVEVAALLADRRINAVVVGPGNGVGQTTREVALAALQTEAAVVLDADALTSFAGAADDLARSIANRKAPVVLTPHEGEITKLFNILEMISPVNSKLEKTLSVASFSRAVTIFKGADTVIAARDGRAAINANAPPWLATAGAGDVLAGFVAGLLAQGMPAFEAAAAAVWLHGEAATRFGPGLIAEDLPEALPGVLRGLGAEA